LDPHDKAVLIYATYPDPITAEAEGRALLETGLAACVNILPGMVSLYRWEGALERSGECVMIIKTRSVLADAAIAVAKGRHPYTTPSFLILRVEGGSADYLDWIVASTIDRG
jgi:periplasmic divalent cation tolerance protein